MKVSTPDLSPQLADARRAAAEAQAAADAAVAEVKRLEAEVAAAKEAAKTPGQKVADWLNTAGPLTLLVAGRDALSARLDEIINAAIAARSAAAPPPVGAEIETPEECWSRHLCKAGTSIPDMIRERDAAHAAITQRKVAEAVRAEREACAKALEDDERQESAKLIRARKETPCTRSPQSS